MTLVPFRRLVATALLALAIVPAQAAGPQPPGALLRQGEWGGEIGTYHPPEAWLSLPVMRWPMDGWGVLVIDAERATLSITPLSVAAARLRLMPITDQLTGTAGTPDAESTPASTAPEGTEDDWYLRVPGLVWRAGAVPLHRFRNGTVQLTPELGRRIQLSIGGRPFTFTLQNGHRTADGRPYGEGVQFTLEVGGQRYDYDLGGYGWEARILALGDFDGDGKPDFLFDIAGSNSGHHAVLLSSFAKPGRNPPTAYLTATGC